MTSKDFLKSVLPLAGGLGLGFLAAQYLLPKTAKFLPEPYLKVNTKGGLFLIPGELPAEANLTSVEYTALVDGIPKTGEVGPLDTIKLVFPWTENKQDIFLKYKNAEGVVVGEHKSKIGDGIILEEIIINKDENGGNIETEEE